MQLAGRSRSTRAAVSEESIGGVILDGIETENVVQLGPAHDFTNRPVVPLSGWALIG